MILLERYNFPIGRPESWTKNIIRRDREFSWLPTPWFVFRPFLITVDGPTAHVRQFGTFGEAIEWASEHPAKPLDMRELLPENTEEVDQ